MILDMPRSFCPAPQACRPVGRIGQFSCGTLKRPTVWCHPLLWRCDGINLRRPTAAWRRDETRRDAECDRRPWSNAGHSTSATDRMSNVRHLINVCGKSCACTRGHCFRADCMNATQISTQLSPLNLLSLLKSSLKQISLHETNAFSIRI